MDNALPRTGNLLIYQNERGDTRVDVYLEQGNLWMTQRAIAELYQVRVPTINYHIRNILADGELDSSTIRDYLIVQTEAGVEKNRNLRHFDFRMILAIGYRVRSNVGMHFPATMIRTAIKQRPSSLRCRTSCITLLPEKRRQRLFARGRMQPSPMREQRRLVA